MKHCPNCKRENPDASTYCGWCGFSLTTARPYAEEYEPTYGANRPAPVPPPPPPTSYSTPSPAYTTTPAPLTNEPYYPTPRPYSSVQPQTYSQESAYTYPNAFTSKLRIKPRTRTFWGTVFSIILYLWAALCTSFGVAAMLISLGSNTVVGFTFIAAAVISLIIPIPILILHKRPLLRWWVRLVPIVILTILAFVGLFFGFGLLNVSHLSQQTSLSDIVLGCVIAAYGIIVALLALL